MDETRYLILLSNVAQISFFNYPAMKYLSEKGTTFNFQNFYPLEPKTAFSQVLTGCNPGKKGFLDICDNPLQFRESKSFEQTLPHLLYKKGFSIEYTVNSFPKKDYDFNFIFIDDFQLLDKVLDIARANNTFIFIIAPVFEKYIERTVNINNFLREKELIETDSNSKIIWENSLAYQKEYGQIWINLVGREPKGTVIPGEEYNEVREALIKGITEKLVDDEYKQPVVERIYKKEELFHGERFSEMADLIITLKQGYGFSQIRNEPIFDASPVMIKSCKSYTAGRGIAIGENIKANFDVKDLAINSIAPSILHYMGLTIPDWMDGKVEEQFFKEEFITGNSPKYEKEQGLSTLSKEDEVLIMERLKGLGYLE